MPFPKSANEEMRLEQIVLDTHDQFLTFVLIESYFQHPAQMRQQHMFQISGDLQHQLIEMYYRLDDEIAREILGKNLKGKHKKDLVDIQGKVKHRIVQRQCDNVRRVYKFATHATEKQISVCEAIENQFSLSKNLALKYVHIAFLCFHGFDTNEKKLPQLNTFKHFATLASILQRYLTTTSNTLDLDDGLDSGLLELKSLLNSSESSLEKFKQLVCADLNQSSLTSSSSSSSTSRGNLVAKIEPKFIQFTKALLHIGASLSYPKEFKDFFIDLDEKVAAIYKGGIGTCDLRVLFTSMINTFPTLLNSFSMNQKQRETSSQIWRKFLSCISDCIESLDES